MDSTPRQLLSPLPQVSQLNEIVRNLWRHPDVQAIWLGGSLSRGSGDQYSDVDLRIAVPLEKLQDWREIDLDRLLSRPVVGKKLQAFGEQAMLHHLLLEGGDIYDLFVQSTQHDNYEHSIDVLACRDDALAARLGQFAKPIVTPKPAADPAVLRSLLIDFWINSHKHRKVLYRRLHLLVMVGIQMEWTNIIRLWHARITGQDQGPVRPSIFQLSQMSSVVEKTLGSAALEVVGADLTTRGNIFAAIQRNRDAVANVGRELAEQHRFEYPTALEAQVRASWEQFCASSAS